MKGLTAPEMVVQTLKPVKGMSWFTMYQQKIRRERFASLLPKRQFSPKSPLSTSFSIRPPNAAKQQLTTSLTHHLPFDLTELSTCKVRRRLYGHQSAWTLLLMPSRRRVLNTASGVLGIAERPPLIAPRPTTHATVTAALMFGSDRSRGDESADFLLVFFPRDLLRGIFSAL